MEAYIQKNRNINKIQIHYIKQAGVVSLMYHGKSMGIQTGTWVYQIGVLSRTQNMKYEIKQFPSS